MIQDDTILETDITMTPCGHGPEELRPTIEVPRPAQAPLNPDTSTCYFSSTEKLFPTKRFCLTQNTAGQERLFHDYRKYWFNEQLK
jgi:hypothetical protein